MTWTPEQRRRYAPAISDMVRLNATTRLATIIDAIDRPAGTGRPRVWSRSSCCRRSGGCAGLVLLGSSCPPSTRHTRPLAAASGAGSNTLCWSVLWPCSMAACASPRAASGGPVPALRRDRAVLLQLGERLAIGRILVGVDGPRDPVPGCASRQQPRSAWPPWCCAGRRDGNRGSHRSCRSHGRGTSSGPSPGRRCRLRRQAVHQPNPSAARRRFLQRNPSSAAFFASRRAKAACNFFALW